jgi:hypothetical protein
MIKVSKLSHQYRIGIALTSVAIALLFAPHIIDHLSSKFARPTFVPKLSGSVSPRPSLDRMTASLDANELFTRLEEADQQWKPQEELLPDGSTRFLYKRRAGEPDLTVVELRSLINDPPSFHAEREAISNLLETLQRAGVRVLLTPTLKKGAAAEWEHFQGVMRIQPDITNKGSLDFLRVLNHESIHVAQSCRGGSLYAKPEPLGVPVSKDKLIAKTLTSPIYMDVSKDEKALELEAYTLQDDIHKANALVIKECNVMKKA